MFKWAKASAGLWQLVSSRPLASVMQDHHGGEAGMEMQSGPPGQVHL